MITTIEELIANEYFQAACRQWEADRCCPREFPDWCYENIGEDAYHAALWALEKEERQIHLGELKTKPSPFTRSSGYCWIYSIDSRSRLHTSDDFPIRPLETDGVPVRYYEGTFVDCIAYYLFNFDMELAQKYPPKNPVNFPILDNAVSQS